MFARFKSIPSSHEWEQSCKAKKFHRALTNYDLLLHALDVSSIYTSVSRHVAPPKSGEDAHITHGIGDLGGPTLYQPHWDLAMYYHDYGILGELVLHLMSPG